MKHDSGTATAGAGAPRRKSILAIIASFSMLLIGLVGVVAAPGASAHDTTLEGNVVCEKNEAGQNTGKYVFTWTLPADPGWPATATASGAITDNTNKALTASWTATFDDGSNRTLNTYITWADGNSGNRNDSKTIGSTANCNPPTPSKSSSVSCSAWSVTISNLYPAGKAVVVKVDGNTVGNGTTPNYSGSGSIAQAYGTRSLTVTVDGADVGLNKTSGDCSQPSKSSNVTCSTWSASLQQYPAGKSVVVKVDGNIVASGSTDAGGNYSGNGNIAQAAGARTITVAFDGAVINALTKTSEDCSQPTQGSSVTCSTWSVSLQQYPAGKSVVVKVDGVEVASGTTSAGGNYSANGSLDPKVGSRELKVYVNGNLVESLTKTSQDCTVTTYVEDSGVLIICADDPVEVEQDSLRAIETREVSWDTGKVWGSGATLGEAEADANSKLPAAVANAKAEALAPYPNFTDGACKDATTYGASRGASGSLTICTTDGKTVKVDWSGSAAVSGKNSQEDANTQAQNDANKAADADKAAKLAAFPGATEGACVPPTTTSPVIAPAPATVPAPAKKPSKPVAAPKPASVPAGFAGTVPSAVPAGGGSSAPQSGLPTWALLLMVAGAAGAVFSIKRLASQR